MPNSKRQSLQRPPRQTVRRSSSGETKGTLPTLWSNKTWEISCLQKSLKTLKAHSLTQRGATKEAWSSSNQALKMGTWSKRAIKCPSTKDLHHWRKSIWIRTGYKLRTKTRSYSQWRNAATVVLTSQISFHRRVHSQTGRGMIQKKQRPVRYRRSPKSTTAVVELRGLTFQFLVINRRQRRQRPRKKSKRPLKGRSRSLLHGLVLFLPPSATVKFSPRWAHQYIRYL